MSSQSIDYETKCWSTFLSQDRDIQENKHWAESHVYYILDLTLPLSRCLTQGKSIVFTIKLHFLTYKLRKNDGFPKIISNEKTRYKQEINSESHWLCNRQRTEDTQLTLSSASSRYPSLQVASTNIWRSIVPKIASHANPEITKQKCQGDFRFVGFLLRLQQENDS